MLPDKIEHCIVFMNYWDVSGVFWSFSKCNIKIPHLPAETPLLALARPCPLRSPLSRVAVGGWHVLVANALCLTDVCMGGIPVGDWIFRTRRL